MTTPPRTPTTAAYTEADVETMQWLVWFARKRKGKARDVAQLALDQNPELRLSEARAAPGPAPLDVERLARAWGDVMDGRRIGSGLHAARIGRDTTTEDDWTAIAREYAKEPQP